MWGYCSCTHPASLTDHDTRHTSQLSLFEKASFHISYIHPDLLWLQLCGRYYAGIILYLYSEDYVVWGVPTNFHYGNTYTSGKVFTYLLWSVLCFCRCGYMGS